MKMTVKLIHETEKAYRLRTYYINEITGLKPGSEYWFPKRVVSGLTEKHFTTEVEIDDAFWATAKPATDFRKRYTKTTVSTDKHDIIDSLVEEGVLSCCGD